MLSHSQTHYNYHGGRLGMKRKRLSSPFYSRQWTGYPNHWWAPWLKWKLSTGLPPYLENLEFCHLLFQVWKMSGVFSKSAKNLEFNSKPGKIVNLKNLMFPDYIFRVSLQKIFYMYIISKLSTPTLNQHQINLGFHCFYLEITWKIHAMSCHQRSGNTAMSSSMMVVKSWAPV